MIFVSLSPHLKKMCKHLTVIVGLIIIGYFSVLHGYRQTFFYITLYLLIAIFNTKIRGRRRKKLNGNNIISTQAYRSLKLCIQCAKKNLLKRPFELFIACHLSHIHSTAQLHFFVESLCVELISSYLPKERPEFENGQRKICNLQR